VKKIISLFLFLFFISILCRAQGLTPDAERFDKALEAMEEKDNGKAFILFNSWLMDHPGDTEAYWYRAILLEEFEQYETALADYNILLEMNPDRAEALMARGRVRYRLGQYEKAKEDFKAFLLAPPGETTQIIYRKSGIGGGISQIFTAQTENPSQAFYHLGLCSIALEENEEAIFYLDSAIHYDRGEADFYAEKGKAQAQMGKNELALESYERALEINPDHFLAIQRIAFLSENANEEALEKLTRAIIESDPGNPEPFKQRGYFRLMNSDPEGAIEDFTEVLLLDPEDIETWYYRGKANASLKNWDNAETDYSNSMEIGGPNAEVFLARGQARYISKKLDSALADFTMAIFHDQDNPSGYYHRGITLQRMRNIAEACPDLLKAKEMGMEEAATVWEAVCGKRN
jgi:tetratricopeptide (TPR) repeat protein